ncbi:hypothetical protein [Rubripirellula obstinata]|nr:hypothetical protein [Rubripirellula obstinata]
MSIDHSPIKPPSSQSDSAVTDLASNKRRENPMARQSLDWPPLVVGKSKSPEKVFGDAAKDGGVYRWGMAVAKSPSALDFDDDEICLTEWGEEPDGELDNALLKSLSRLGCDLKRKSKKSSIDWIESAHQAISQFESLKDPTADQAAMAVVWAAAIPKLETHLDVTVLADLTHALLELRESVLLRSDVSSISHLILGGELGLTLAWRMPGLRSRAAILKSAGDAVADWAASDEDSISAAVAGATSVRLALASLIRCRCLMKAVAKRKFSKQNIEVAESLATWVAAMTGNRGTSAFSNAGPKAVKDDCGKHGLLSAAKSLDREAIGLAMDAAMGKGHSGGRLAWEVSLPESMWCDETNKMAVLLPEWDASRGRTHIDFSGPDVTVEVFAGRTAMIAGRLKSSLEIDGTQQQATSDWDEICRYTDDDVHYLELEQSWTSDYLIQRQFLLMREDRCLMLADAVIPKNTESSGSDSVNETKDLNKIDYQVSLPLAHDAAAIEEQETREVILRSGGGTTGGKQAMLLPLSASEWKMGPTSSKLILANPDQVVFQASGRERLYAPLWIDFNRRRLKRMRTWRQLTVCDALELVPKSEAAAFRIQVGSEQWVVYRSLNDQRCRSFLGKHIMADFYVSKFDTGDGTHDALITVDDADEGRP